MPRLKLLSGLSALLLALPTTAATQATDPAPVNWQGSLRAVQDGDLSGNIALAGLAEDQHLYALGPMADLDGEITVMDGHWSIARDRDGVIRIDTVPAGQAAFLVWADVPRWAPPHSFRAAISGLSQLESAVRRLADVAGIAHNAAFPFEVQGKFTSLDLHVVRKPKAAGHPAPPLRIHAENVRGRLVGFHASNHEGAFIGRGRAVHVHVVLEDGRSGHVDGLVLDEHATLKLPAAPARPAPAARHARQTP